MLGRNSNYERSQPDFPKCCILFGYLPGGAAACVCTLPSNAGVERIFARKPTVVITGRRKFLARNNRTAAIVERHLWCEYRLAQHIKASSKRTLEMWTRRPDPLIPCPATHPPLGIVQTTSS